MNHNSRSRPGADSQARALDMSHQMARAVALLREIKDGAAVADVISDDIDHDVARCLFIAAETVRHDVDRKWAEVATRTARSAAPVTEAGMSFLREELQRAGAPKWDYIARFALLLGERAFELKEDILALIKPTDFDNMNNVRAIGNLLRLFDAELLSDLAQALLYDSNECAQSIGSVLIQRCPNSGLQHLDRLVKLSMGGSKELQATVLETFCFLAAEFGDRLAHLHPLFADFWADSDAIIRVRAILGATLVAPKAVGNLNAVISEWSTIDHNKKLGTLMSADDDEELRTRLLCTALVQAATVTGNSEANDFLLQFLATAFHHQGTRFIDLLINHDFYRKIQRKQLLLLLNGSVTPAKLQDLFDEASQEFTLRLLENPTLGMQLEESPKIAGFIRNHARDIAKRVYRRVIRQVSPQKLIAYRQAIIEPEMAGNEASSKAIIAEMQDRFVEFFHDILSRSERAVVLGRIVGGMSLDETAEAVGLTVAQVRYQLDGVLAKLAEYLDLPHDRGLLLGVTELFAVNACCSLGPGPESQAQ